MVGSRRGTGRPTKLAMRVERRKAHMVTRLGKAKTPLEQVAAATDYARSVIALMAPAQAEAAARALISAIESTVVVKTGPNRKRSTSR